MPTKVGTKMSLSYQVKARLENIGVEASQVSKTDALQRAIDLADLFSYVTPNVSTIPLDAMAGFPVPQSEKNA